ncbi:hypothetical protein LGR54_04430 [Ancylobacter sp. Lp-2]|uniref:hypothetical protein n=1 Tax=Ancylobacter sp. Lp-2 TaxID=2881339 RepID=UPI001E4F2B23|nr:hypothetical protein [Ancylobacter sp. Lp-2]MCB4767841.1 hypothetical protein [Ancylobacter sp. Lp-2]
MRWLTGGTLTKITSALTDAYQAKLTAANDAAKLEAEQTIAKLEAARDIALAEAGDRWSAVRLGRLLIVIPYGLWWSAIYLVQIINPWFGLHLVVVDVPEHINGMAMILIPAIILGDAGALAVKAVRR